MTNTTTAINGASILCVSVTKSFPGSSGAVLQNVSFEVQPGEIVSIVGRSGMGKSTLLRLISGLLDPDVGEVLIADQLAADARDDKRIGFMPQAPALLPWLTVERNVDLVNHVNRRSAVADVDASLDAVGLWDQRRKLPHELSGGMQQRVALARAIAVGGCLLALDEPFTALDELTRESLYDLVVDVWRKTRSTIVFVTHNLDEALLLSDRVILLGGNPATVKGIVPIVGERPRRVAIDRGAYASELAEIRSLLEEAV